MNLATVTLSEITLTVLVTVGLYVAIEMIIKRRKKSH